MQHNSQLSIFNSQLSTFNFQLSILNFLFLIAACSPARPAKIPPQQSPKVVLGHYLFFEKKISINNTKSCASCHDPVLAFSDGYRRSVGVFGDIHPRNSPSLVNAIYHRTFNLANPDVRTLTQQHYLPLYNTAPIEMGVAGNEATILARIAQDSLYKTLFSKAFRSPKDRFSWTHIVEAIAAYTSTLVSLNSPYDRYLAGDLQALSPSAAAGRSLFFSPRLRCGKCHNGLMLSTNSRFALDTNVANNYANIGIYAEGENPSTDKGLMNVTHNPQDEGKFIIPSLRNVFLTAPYMHDGSIATLPEVLKHYSKGGKKQANLDTRISAFPLSQEEEKDILNFLESLTDTSYLRKEHFRNPFRLADERRFRR